MNNNSAYAQPKKLSVALHFDSLSEAYGWPASYVDDKSYSVVADRLFQIADKFGFKYSIFVLGKDMENPNNRARVREWAGAGHEIANHTYSHPTNLSGMRLKGAVGQIQRSHELITEAAGKPPVGFVAPNWSFTHRNLPILADLGYVYDASLFPSWMMFPMLLKIAANYLHDPKIWRLFHRRGYQHHLWGRREAYSVAVGRDKKEINVLPVPTTPWRMPCWHTLAFVLGWDVYEKILRNAVQSSPFFQYVIHPADMMHLEDCDPRYNLGLERMTQPLEVKIEYLERAFEIMAAHGNIQPIATHFSRQAA